jgi:hypothetical protein
MPAAADDATAHRGGGESSIRTTIWVTSMAKRRPAGAGRQHPYGTTSKTLVSEHGPVRVDAPEIAMAAMSRKSCASASDASRL